MTSKPDVTKPKHDAETLLNLGFIDVATWTVSGETLFYRLDGPHADANAIRLEETNALYAFVRGGEVLYIGKTARTIRKRFLGVDRRGIGGLTQSR